MGQVLQGKEKAIYLVHYVARRYDGFRKDLLQLEMIVGIFFLNDFKPLVYRF